MRNLLGISGLSQRDPTAPPDGASTSAAEPGAAIASTMHARRCKEIMALYHDMRQLGAGDIIGLPCIAVIGSQSAGKSSLVEAVTDINVPRDSGTCTRCPMECTISSAATSWSCQLSLRYDYEKDGTKMAPKTVVFGPKIADKCDVDLYIRRAQAAILSSHVDPGHFLNKSVEELREAAREDAKVLKFSKNVVVIKIDDPSAVDLQFIDLPGLIQNEDPEVIKLVRELVEFYIKGRDTVILVTIPMSDEMENQQAVALAKYHDRHGERTIGVLTKPDMLSAASQTRQKYRSILEGNAHPLRHGYYAVRLPSEDERSSQPTKASITQCSETFFAETSPWSLMHDRSRFGIDNLVIDISRLLVIRIEESLPKLIDEVNIQLYNTSQKLAALPQKFTGDPTTSIVNLVSKFCSHFEGAVHGSSKTRTLIQANRKRYKDFRVHILKTAPQFRIKHASGKQVKEYEKVLDHAVSRLPCRSLDLDDVRAVIEGSVTWELKFAVPFNATKMLIQAYINLWDSPSIMCFDDACVNLVRLINFLLDDHFASLPKLQAFIRSTVNTQFEIYKSAAHQRVLYALELEKEPLFTMDDEGLAAQRQGYIEQFRRSRQTHQDIQFSPDLYESEIILMADVKAYFDLVVKRIIDVLPLTIEHALNRAFVSNLQTTLLHSIFSEGSNKLAELVTEDPELAKKRADLMNLRDRLGQMKDRLDEFGRTCVGAGYRGDREEVRHSEPVFEPDGPVPSRPESPDSESGALFPSDSSDEDSLPTNPTPFSVPGSEVLT